MVESWARGESMNLQEKHPELWEQKQGNEQANTSGAI